MRFHHLIETQSDDEAHAIFHAQECKNFWIETSERFPKLWRKVKLLLLAFPTTYFAEQGFYQVLHTRNKYRNRLDMNKTCGNATRLYQLTNMQTALKKHADKHHGKVRISLSQLFFGNDKI